ncbi:drug resistance transporter, EmrB/QacA subfamily [Seinonella peptonophila]|uniref:Drug resistance transporter, EmrB/QacA subfamily n=1 Tax=Seinonella peptonophila TaxID=112248 RepID=A0A1M4TYJ7_9BACL|nr:MFS transporter [Seinonella peptonophila]SHE49568.1 drug resistance transporter, EmrB/QacA subfamily [Seinonella peptonophila]
MSTLVKTRYLTFSLVLLALAQLIYALDLNIVFVALPEIGRELGFTGQTLQWVVSAYTIFCGGFMLFGGRAADLIGQKKMFIFALLVYGLSSLLGGLSWNTTVIIIARSIQGIGGALLFPATLSLINRLFEEGPSRNRALAVWGGAGASGLTIGSLLGGVLTNSYGWEAVFYVNVPLAGIVALAALFVLPADQIRDHKRSFDIPGAITVTLGATLLVYVLVQGPESGWTSLSVIICAIGSIILLTRFALIEQRTSDPLMPISLLHNRHLVTGLTTTFIYMGTFGALPYFLTVLFQNVQHFNALQTGFAFFIPSIAIAIGTQLGAQFTTRFTARNTLLTGFMIGVIGTALLPLGSYPDSNYWFIVPGLVISGIGQGITWTCMWIIASIGVKDKEQGVASGIASTSLNIGNAIGMAVLIAIANAGVHGKTGSLLLTSIASGSRTAFYLASVGMLVGTIVALTLPRQKKQINQ